MVNNEILEGLRTAMLRGESLQKAMLTFFNAGYSKIEIEQAAAVIQGEKREIFKPETTAQPEQKKPEVKKAEQTKVEQQASKYGEEKAPTKKNGLIIFLIILLVILFAGLAGMFFFKDQIMSVLSSLFD